MRLVAIVLAFLLAASLATGYETCALPEPAPASMPSGMAVMRAVNALECNLRISTVRNALEYIRLTPLAVLRRIIRALLLFLFVAPIVRSMQYMRVTMVRIRRRLVLFLINPPRLAPPAFIFASA